MEGSSQEHNCSGQSSQLGLAEKEHFKHNYFPLPNAHLGFKKILAVVYCKETIPPPMLAPDWNCP